MVKPRSSADILVITARREKPQSTSTLTSVPTGSRLSILPSKIFRALVGTLLSASLNVTFLKTAQTGIEGNETFFDFSNGFEDFALLGKQDAALLEAANFGVEAAPSGVSYSEQAPTITFEEAGLPTPGAPAPPLIVLAALGAVAVWKARKHAPG